MRKILAILMLLIAILPPAPSTILAQGRNCHGFSAKNKAPTFQKGILKPNGTVEVVFDKTLEVGFQLGPIVLGTSDKPGSLLFFNGSKIVHEARIGTTYNPPYEVYYDWVWYSDSILSWGGGAIINICNTAPTPTPPPAPVPVGCFVQSFFDGSTAILRHEFAATSSVHPYMGRMRWESDGPGQGGWVDLAQHGEGIATVIQAGYTEHFQRSNLTPYAQLLVCPQAATPTATATASPGPSLPADCRQFNSVPGHKGYEMSVGADVVAAFPNMALSGDSPYAWKTKPGVEMMVPSLYVPYNMNLRSSGNGSHSYDTWHLRPDTDYLVIPGGGPWYNQHTYVVCMRVYNPATPTAISGSPTATAAMPTATATALPTRTPLPTRTATNTTTPTGTATATASPTVTPIHGRPPGLSCAIADSINLPKPGVPAEQAYRELVYLVAGGQFAVVGADASVLIHVDGTSYPFNSGVYTWNLPTGTYLLELEGTAITIQMGYSATIWVCNNGPTPTSTATATGTPTGTALATATATPIGDPVLPCLYSTYVVGWAPLTVNFSQGQLYQVLDFPIQVDLGGAGYSLAGVGLWNEPTGSYTVRGTGVSTSRLAVCVGSGTPTITPLAYTPTPNAQAIGLRFEQSQRSVREDAESVELVVLLTRVMTYAVSVDVSTTSYTAMAHSDFGFTSGTLTFYPGQTRITVAVPILDDLAVEQPEIFHVRLSNPQAILVSKQRGGRAGLMAPAPQQRPQIGLSWPAVKEVTIIDDDRDAPPTTTIADICVLVPATATPGTPMPWPTIPLALPTLKPLPPLPAGGILSGTPITATNEYPAAATLVAEWAEPAATLSAWSSTLYGDEGPVARGEADAALLVERVAPALGWLGLWEMLGPLAYVLPPILIVLSVRLVRSVLAIIRYFRSIMPR